MKHYKIDVRTPFKDLPKAGPGCDLLRFQGEQIEFLEERGHRRESVSGPSRGS